MANRLVVSSYYLSTPDARPGSAGYTSGGGTLKSSSQPNASLTTLEDKPLYT